MRELHLEDQAIPLTPAELRQRCDSPVFRKALWYTEGATVQPARLALALRRAIIESGVKIYEDSPVVDVRPGKTNTVITAAGSVRACEVALTTNAALAAFPSAKRFITNFSSYVAITNPAPEVLEATGWTKGEGISDGRMFIHYFRRTPDGRIAMGTPGPVGYGGRFRSKRVLYDINTVARLQRAISHFFPGFSDVGIEAAWGGPVDVSSDNYPFFGTVPDTRIHYSAGYSGHGVNATYLGGQCLASLILRHDDEWARNPLMHRTLPKFPPEPFRFIGASLIRDAIVACEDAEEAGKQPPQIQEFIASLPAKLHLRIGTR